MLLRDKPSKEPNVGDYCTETKFALFPTEMTNGEVILWEKYEVTYKLVREYPWGENYFMKFNDVWKTYSKKRLKK